MTDEANERTLDSITDGTENSWWDGWVCSLRGSVLLFPASAYFQSNWKCFRAFCVIIDKGEHLLTIIYLILESFSSSSWRISTKQFLLSLWADVGINIGQDAGKIVITQLGLIHPRNPTELLLNISSQRWHLQQCKQYLLVQWHWTISSSHYSSSNYQENNYTGLWICLDLW